MDDAPETGPHDSGPEPRRHSPAERVKIRCGHCDSVYSLKIDDRRIKKPVIMIPCPKCREKITVRLRPDEADGRTPEPAGNGGAGTLKEKIFKSMADLPPMPQVVLKAQEVMANPDSDLKKLAAVIKMDPSMVIRILKMANSSYYGLPGKVSSIEHATVLLGQKTLGEVITMAGVSDLLGRSLQGYSLDSGDLWRHSMAVAFGSKMIAQEKVPELTNDAFVAGLLHDAGKIILDAPVLERKPDFEKFMENEDATFLQAETAILGFDHCEIAAEMCRRWNIPASIATAIGYHHYPSRSDEDLLSYILHLADYIATLSGVGIGTDDLLYEKEDGTLSILGFQQKAVSELMFRVIEACNQIEEAPEAA